MVSLVWLACPEALAAVFHPAVFPSGEGLPVAGRGRRTAYWKKGDHRPADRRADLRATYREAIQNLAAWRKRGRRFPVWCPGALARWGVRAHAV